MPTFQTLLPDNIFPFLDEMAKLYIQMEREMHVCLMRGESIAAIEKSLQSKYKVDSTTTRNVYHNLKGKHQGVKELRKVQVKELKNTIKSIKSAIKKRLKKKQLTQKDRFIVHQKKRRLANKQHKLKVLQNKEIKLCFGSKKLFLAQYNLEANGYSSHDDWLTDWRACRQSNFMMVGAKTYTNGNQLCRLTADGQLKITVPPCLFKQFGSHVSCDEIKFRYGQEFIDIALNPVRRFSTYNNGKKKTSRIGTEKAVTHRFVKKNDKWYLHSIVELPDIPWISHRRNGAIGVDLNADNIAWTYCDGSGNLASSGQIDIDLEGKSSGQATHILSLAIDQIIDIAVDKHCPIVIEKLDFSQKKASLRELSKRYAKMLSAFAYSKFSELIHSKSNLAAIQVKEANPGYSSLIGMVKYMSLYGLNSGTAAALVLARRGLRFSERLPRCLNTLFSPVDGNRHVWHYWARISKMTKGCYRHSFFEMRVRVGVTPNNQSLETGRKLLGKSKDASIIPNDASALGIMSA